MKIVFPDYNQCGLNVISSIKKFFGAKPHHQTLSAFDSAIPPTTDKIILMLFDGMGIATLQDFLPADSFLRRNILLPLTAVFPSTTTNATTSIETDASPKEHGWLGWTLYFKEIDKPVDIFLNKSNGEEAADFPVAQTFLPRGDAFRDITEETGVPADLVSPYSENYPTKTLDDLFSVTLSLCDRPGRRYIYAYWPEPDHTMHDKGVYHADIAAIVRDINARLEAFSNQLPEDTLLLVTADHGLINSRHHYLEDDPQLASMLLRAPSVEARAAAFYVKPECLRRFPEIFEEKYGKHFLLYTPEAFIQKFLGPGKENPRLRDLIGDYIAVATDMDGMDGYKKNYELTGWHAGLTDREMLVPLVFFTGKH